MKEGKHSTFNIQRPTPKDLQRAAFEFEEGPGEKRTFDLEGRLLEFAAAAIDLSESLPATRAGNHIAGQILRSGTSPYPNHGEAEAAESRGDFIHKLKICLKELRETRRWARLIRRKAWVNNEATLLFVLSEGEELIRVFHSSIRTAKRNARAEARKSSDPARHTCGEADCHLDVGR
jgi:four helix bundle protein